MRSSDHTTQVPADPGAGRELGSAGELQIREGEEHAESREKSTGTLAGYEERGVPNGADLSLPTIVNKRETVAAQSPDGDKALCDSQPGVQVVPQAADIKDWPPAPGPRRSPT